MKSPVNASVQLLFFQLILMAAQFLSAVLSLIILVFIPFGYGLHEMWEPLFLMVCSWFFWDANVNIKRHYIEPRFIIEAKNRRHHRAIKRRLDKKLRGY